MLGARGVAISRRSPSYPRCIDHSWLFARKGRTSGEIKQQGLFQSDAPFVLDVDAAVSFRESPDARADEIADRGEVEPLGNAVRQRCR